MLEEHDKLQALTPQSCFSATVFPLEDHDKLQALTPPEFINTSNFALEEHDKLSVLTPFVIPEGRYRWKNMTN
ncbi:hypothetical protein M0Q97_13375 [Candidatus Dojkabacteria bacterium]|nr:hypothetical protein [Candidatus Dojkabacteria bacterium]